MLIVDLSISALEWLPICWNGSFQSFPSQINEPLIFRQFHSKNLNGILSDLLFGGLIIRINFLDQGFRVFFLKLVLFVDVVHLVIGHELLLIHGSDVRELGFSS